MRVLHLLTLGDVDRELIDWLRRELVETFRVRCELVRADIGVEFSYHPERDQYHSSEILAAIQPLVQNDTWRLLCVTAVDLYIPILTFVLAKRSSADHARWFRTIVCNRSSTGFLQTETC